MLINRLVIKAELLIRFCGFVCVLLFASFACANKNDSTGTVKLYSDVPVGKVGEVTLTIDIASAYTAGNAARPALVIIHGGAWRRGSKESKRKSIEGYASKGFVGAALMYRFAPDYTFPAQVEDVKAAIRFLKVNAATYGIDPNRIIVLGTSAGAHLAAMLAVTGNNDPFATHGLWESESASIFAAILLAGPLAEFEHPSYRNNQSLAMFLGAKPSDAPELAAAAMPITYVDETDSPMFIAHGDADTVVNVQASRVFTSALAKEKVRYEYRELAGAGHAIAKTHPDIYKQALQFIKQLIAEANKKQAGK